MPCRALEAFRRSNWAETSDSTYYSVLMPCRALEAFRRVPRAGNHQPGAPVLMPCRALEAFRRRKNESVQSRQER